MAKANAISAKSIEIHRGLGAALLLVAILAAYSNHFNNSFHYDDGHRFVIHAGYNKTATVPPGVQTCREVHDTL